MKRSPSLFFLGALLVVGVIALGHFALAQDAKPGAQPESVQASAGDLSPDQAVAPKPVAPGAVPPLGEIKIEKILPQRVLTRQITGGYEKHQEVFSDIKGTVVRTLTAQAAVGGNAAAKAAATKAVAAAAAADCVGLYAFDPDTVEKTSLQWNAAVIVPTTFKAPAIKARALSVPASEYKVQTLPAVDAAVMYSTVGRAPVDGLKFFPWLAENGYAQIGPTRMVYFSDTTVDLLKATPEQIRNTRTKIIVPIKKRDRNIALTKEQ